MEPIQPETPTSDKKLAAFKRKSESHPSKICKANTSDKKTVTSSNSILDQDDSILNSRKGLRRQWSSSIIASLSYVILGTALGWPSPVLYNIDKYREPITLSHMDTTVMVSLFYLGNALVPIPSGLLSDWVGRKASMLYLTILPLASWIFIWVAVPTVMIHIARFLMGMYSGLALTVLPLYLGEIAEPNVRGKLAFMLQLLQNMGLVFAYIVGAYVSYGTFAIILGVFPIVLFFLLLLIPESPYWLRFKGKDIEASKSLAWLRGVEVAHQVNKFRTEEYSAISISVRTAIDESSSFKMLFTTKSYRKAVTIMEVISVCQRFSGISALMAYISITIPMIPQAGLTANVCAVIMGCANIFGVLIAIPIVDSVGRIPLLIVSSIGCGLAMLSATVWYFLNQNIQHALFTWIPLTVFCMYGVFFNVGLGPMPALLQGELFPSNLKGKASAINVMVVSASSAIVNFMYIPIGDAAGHWCNFLIYSVTCVACLIFTWTFAFETKGKTLAEIQTRLTQLF